MAIQRQQPAAAGRVQPVDKRFPEALAVPATPAEPDPTADARARNGISGPSTSRNSTGRSSPSVLTVANLTYDGVAGRSHGLRPKDLVNGQQLALYRFGS